MDVPVEVTQEEGRTRLLHLPSAVLTLSFLARRIHPYLSLVGIHPYLSLVGIHIHIFCEEKFQFV